MGRGIVYCLTNPAMPEMVKIGLVEKADKSALKQRISGLYTTSIPVPFELYYAVSVDNVETVEKLLHDVFKVARENPKREFFRVDPESVVAAMRLTGGEEITVSDSPDPPNTDIDKTDLDALKRSRIREDKKLSNFTFEMVGIPKGAILTFTRDDSIIAEVLGGNKIKYRDKETTLSAAATEILRGMGGKSSVAGTLYWEYNGKTLTQIRREKFEDDESSTNDC